MKRLIAVIAAGLSLVWLTPAVAQQQGQIKVYSSCGTASYSVGKLNYATGLPTGETCTSGSGGGSALPNSTATTASPTYTTGTNNNLSTDIHGSIRNLNMDASGNPLDNLAPINCGTTDTFVQCFAQGAANLVTLGANQSVNTAQVNGVTTLTGTGATGTGSQRVTVATDSATIAGSAPSTILTDKIDQTTPGTTNAVAIKDVNNVAPDFTTTAPVGPMIAPGKNVAGVFTQAVSETCSSGNVANATVACTLATASSKTTYITGFTMTADGATVGLAVSCTLTGTITGTMTFTFGYPIGVAVPAQPLNVQFSYPIPASATNTTIVASCPASGTGGTNAAISATGFLL